MVQVDSRAKTARRSIGNGFPVVYRQVKSLALKGKMVLDFGCGYGQAKQLVDAQGGTYVGTDLVNRTGEGWFVESPKDRFFDVVLLSNVLNVQESIEDLRATIKAALSALAPKGILVFNYPQTPRRLPFGPKVISAYVDQELEEQGLNASVWLVK